VLPLRTRIAYLCCALLPDGSEVHAEALDQIGAVPAERSPRVRAIGPLGSDQTGADTDG